MKISTDWEHGTGKPHGMSRTGIDLGPEGFMDIAAGPDWLSILNRRTGATQPSYLDPTQARAVALALLEGIALHRAKTDQPEDMHLSWALAALGNELGGQVELDPPAACPDWCARPPGHLGPHLPNQTRPISGEDARALLRVLVGADRDQQTDILADAQEGCTFTFAGLTIAADDDAQTYTLTAPFQASPPLGMIDRSEGPDYSEREAQA